MLKTIIYLSSVASYSWYVLNTYWTVRKINSVVHQQVRDAERYLRWLVRIFRAVEKFREADWLDVLSWCNVKMYPTSNNLQRSKKITYLKCTTKRVSFLEGTKIFKLIQDQKEVPRILYKNQVADWLKQQKTHQLSIKRPKQTSSRPITCNFNWVVHSVDQCPDNADRILSLFLI